MSQEMPHFNIGNNGPENKNVFNDTERYVENIVQTADKRIAEILNSKNKDGEKVDSSVVDNIMGKEASNLVENKEEVFARLAKMSRDKIAQEYFL